MRLNLLLCDERHRRAGRRAVLCCGGERQAQPRDRALADDPRSIGVGAFGPVAITWTISTDPQMIGAASGLYGFMQVANGAA